MVFINKIKNLFLLSGDIEVNLGPKRSSNIKFCHWNLNRLAAYDFIKVALKYTFTTIMCFDIVYLSETFLDSTIPDDDINIQINGYLLDHLNNIKRGGVCIYIKELLHLIRRNYLTNLRDCLITEINVNNEKFFFPCLYRSPIQNHD